MLSWWTTIVLFFNGTSMLSNYLSKLSGWTLIVLLLIVVWQRKRIQIGSVIVGMLMVLLFQGWISYHQQMSITVASLVLGVVDQATSTAISPARITSSLKDSYPEFVGHISKRDPKWWKKYGADQSTALVLVDDQEMQDKIKAYLFPHLMEGTGLLLQSVVEWWDLMVAKCDSNRDGRLELKDMEKCRFDQIARPKKFDVLVERVNTFLQDQQNVENLWRYVLEQQHSLEQANYDNYDNYDNYNNYNNYKHDHIEEEHGRSKPYRNRKTEL